MPNIQTTFVRHVPAGGTTCSLAAALGTCYDDQVSQKPPVKNPIQEPALRGKGLKPERFSCRIYGVLLRDDEHVLLTRSRFITREFVNFPGGGVELGESPMEALAREYQEETGIQVRPVRVLYASEGLHLSTQMPMQIVSIYWLVERTTGELRRGGNGDDVIDLFWAHRAKIPTAEMFPSDKEFAERLPGLLR